MGVLKKKHDPISERTRKLNAEIAELEARIKKLQEKSAPQKSGPFANPVEPRGREPIFERVDQAPLQEPPKPVTRHHFNELGLRKYDLTGLIDRIKKHIYGPPVSNPKLVSYLAAGSVQGLRSLRYEKRVARNRFIAWTVFLAVVIFGVIAAVIGR